MSPSRGTASASMADVSANTPTSNNSSLTPTERKAARASSSALASLRTNLQYLFSPSSPTAPRPVHLRTRALLRSLHYLGTFLFWRIVRYAKYAIVGSLVTAVGATAFGGMVSGVGWVLAPPSLLASVGLGTLWALGKWGFRKAGVGRRVEENVRVVESEGRAEVQRDGGWRGTQGPQVAPW